MLISGKYAGEEGVIEKIDLKEKMLEVKSDSKNINAQIKQVIIIG